MFDWYVDRVSADIVDQHLAMGAQKMQIMKDLTQVASMQSFNCILHVEYISSILEQKLEFLKRTQTSLNFGFFIQSAAHE